MSKFKELNHNDWYGYMHVNGSLHVKRLLSHKDMYEVAESDFVYQVVILSAHTREEALEEIHKFFNKQRGGYQYGKEDEEEQTQNQPKENSK